MCLFVWLFVCLIACVFFSLFVCVCVCVGLFGCLCVSLLCKLVLSGFVLGWSPCCTIMERFWSHFGVQGALWALLGCLGMLLGALGRSWGPPGEPVQHNISETLGFT